MSALDSNTPYQEMVDKPMSIEMSNSKPKSSAAGSAGSLNSKEPTVLLTIKEEKSSKQQKSDPDKVQIEDGQS